MRVENENKRMNMTSQKRRPKKQGSARREELGCMQNRKRSGNLQRGKLGMGGLGVGAGPEKRKG